MNVDKSHNRFEILEKCTDALAQKYSTPFDMGEPMFLADIYSTLNRVPGVIDTKWVKIVLKTGASYAPTAFTIEEGQSADGTYLKAPQNACFEIKFPSQDIRGKIK